MNSRIQELHEASVKIGEVTAPIAEAIGTGGAAVALVNVAIQILVQTHPKAEIVRWLRHQADQLEVSDIASAGGNA